MSSTIIWWGSENWIGRVLLATEIWAWKKKTEQNRSKKISVCLKKSRMYHWRCWGETLLLLAVLTELRLFLTFGSFLDRLWNIHFSWFVCVCGGGRLVHTYHQVFKGFGNPKMIRPIRLLDESILNENIIFTFFMVFLHMCL